MRATAWVRGTVIGELELEPGLDAEAGGGDEHWGRWGLLRLSPGTDEIFRTVALADQALSNLGFLGGVTDEGDRLGRAAIEALRELETSISLRTIEGVGLVARVWLWPLADTPDQLHIRVDLHPGDGGAAVGARLPVPPRRADGVNTRPDV